MGEQWVQEKVIGFAHLFAVARAGPFHNPILLDGSFVRHLSLRSKDSYPPEERLMYAIAEKTRKESWPKVGGSAL